MLRLERLVDRVRIAQGSVLNSLSTGADWTAWVEFEAPADRPTRAAQDGARDSLLAADVNLAVPAGENLTAGGTLVLAG